MTPEWSDLPTAAAGAKFQNAQRAVIACAFHHGPEVLYDVPPELLDRPWREIGMAMLALTTRGLKIDLPNITDECQQAGFTLPHALTWMGSYVDSAAEAHALYVQARAEVTVEQDLIRAQQRLAMGAELWPVVDDLRDQLDALARPALDEPDPWHTLPDILDMAEITAPWVIPGLLTQRERCVITGAEGHGKSTLIYQLALGAAYGVSPLNIGHRYAPQRVMILDVENTHETQVAHTVRKLHSAYRPHAADPNRVPDLALLKRRTVNLMSPTDRRHVLDQVQRYQPDLLVMGSGYKLVDSSDWREVFQATTRTADIAKSLSPCAVLLEMHAGHGNAGDRNGWRPDGASSWMRWPEFGIGLAPMKDTTRRMVEVHRWRGDRTVGRAWPAAWRGGGSLPWTPMSAEEFEAEGSYAATA